MQNIIRTLDVNFSEAVSHLNITVIVSTIMVAFLIVEFLMCEPLAYNCCPGEAHTHQTWGLPLK